jgi:hypothetical protein
VDTFAAQQGARECTPCGPGLTTEGREGAAQCVADGCAPGFEPAAAPGDCAPCAAGFFKRDRGNFACLPCPDGQVSLPGATTCFLPADGPVYSCSCTSATASSETETVSLRFAEGQHGCGL